MSNEKWFTIPKFPTYEMNEQLQVRHKVLQKIKSPFLDRGYLKHNIDIGGTKHKPYLHQLVGNVFIPNPENKPQLHHIDEDKLNNHWSNLMWVTQKEHIAITIANEQNSHKISRENVVYIRDNYSHEKKHELAKRFDVMPMTIYLIAIGATRKEVKEGRISEPTGLGKKIINIETGEIYQTAKSVSIATGIKPKEITRMLNGERYNKTPFRYLGEEHRSVMKPERTTPIAMFDMNWGYLKTFTNISIAEKELSTTAIYDFLNGKQSHVKGFKFKRIDKDGNYIEPTPFVPFVRPPKKIKIKQPITPPKEVIKLDLDGNEVERFRSIVMAAKSINCEKGNFRRLIKKSPRNYYKGFIWKIA